MRAFSVILLLAAGCQENLYFSDDEGGPRHSTSVQGEHDDELSLPYAMGTRVGIALKGPVDKATGWRMVSDSPSLFAVVSQVDDQGTLRAEGHALAEGEARIRVLDDRGAERRSAQVTVRAPDRARLFSHGDLRIIANDDASAYDRAEVSDVRVLVGGKAVLAVAYYRGLQRVYGRGIAETDDATVRNLTSSGSATNEWLFITPSATGAYTVGVKQGATALASLDVSGIAESELSGLSLAEQQGGSRNDNDQVWVLARARDGTGGEVLGVYCDWTLDGAPQKGSGEQTQGDLYRFRHATSGAKRTLSARRGTLTAELAVSAHDGVVNDTTYLGCSTAPGGAAARPSLLGLAAVFLLFSIRNRKTRSGMANAEIDAPTTNDRGR